MTFSAFLFVIYLVVLVLALVSSSWVAHLRPAPLDAQRVTDAVQRAGRRQLTATWGPAACCLTSLSGLALWAAPEGGSLTMLFVAAPLAGALGAALVAASVGRQLSRVAGQLAGAKTADTLTNFAGQSALSGALTAAATAGALVAGADLLGRDLLAPVDQLKPGLLALAAGAAVLAIFCRALAVAWSAAAEGVAPGREEDLGAGTLASLVGTTFGAGTLRGAVLFTLFGLGQLALTVAAPPGAAGLPSIAAYAQLLLPLGLFAAAFGAVAFRSSAREPSSWAWVRGSCVALVIFLAGAWSLSGLVGEQELRGILPASVSFVSLGLALAAFLGTVSWASTRSSGPRPSGGHAYSPQGTVAPLVSWALPLLLAFAFLGTVSDESTPAGAIAPVVLAAGLGLLPLLVLLQMAADAVRASVLCEVLASEGQTLPSRLAAEVTPSPTLRLVGTSIVPLVTLTSIDLLWGNGEPQTHVPWLTGLGGLIGALSVLQLSSATGHLAHRGARSLKGLALAAGRQPELLAPLGAGLDAASIAGSQEQWLWLAALLLPPSVIAALRPLESAAHLDGLAGGYLVGVVGAAVLLSLRLDAEPSGGPRPIAGLAVPSALAVLTWTICVFVLFSS